MGVLKRWARKWRETGLKMLGRMVEQAAVLMIAIILVVRAAVWAELDRRKAMATKKRKTSKFHYAPGFKLESIAEFLFSKKNYTTIFEPIIRDLQDEHIEALAENRPWKARYVALRGYFAFWAAVWAHWSGSAIRLLLKALGARFLAP